MVNSAEPSLLSGQARSQPGPAVASSRVFRNSTDAAVTKRALSLLGVRIVSSPMSSNSPANCTPR